MQDPMLGPMHRSFVSLAFVVALAAGCGEGEAPPALADYAGVWSGAISLDGGGELPVTFSLVTTELDEGVATDPASPYRWVFGRLELESEGYALAVVGVARHEAWSLYDEEEAQPDEAAGEGEFLHFFVLSAIWRGHASEAYAADYASFVGRVGLIEPEWHSFDLSLERLVDGSLEGTFGEISTDELDAEGSALDMTWKPRGTVALARSGELPPDAHSDESTLVLDPFVFSVWVEAGELWWDVTVE